MLGMREAMLSGWTAAPARGERLGLSLLLGRPRGSSYARGNPAAGKIKALLRKVQKIEKKVHSPKM